MISFARYLLTAGAATCVDVGIVQTMLSFETMRQPYFFALAIVLGGLAGMLVNFTLSRRFVFASDHRSARQQLATFALVSLTTIGFGDIIPLSNIARMLVLLEAIIGMFYMTIMIARLVSLYSSHKPAS